MLPLQVDIPTGQFAQNLLNLQENKLPVNPDKDAIIAGISEHFLAYCDDKRQIE